MPPIAVSTANPNFKNRKEVKKLSDNHSKKLDGKIMIRFGLIIFWYFLAMILPVIFNHPAFPLFKNFDLSPMFPLWQKLLPLIFLSFIVRFALEFYYFFKKSEKNHILEIIFYIIHILLCVYVVEMLLGTVLPAKKAGIAIVFTKKHKLLSYLFICIFLLWELVSNLIQVFKTRKNKNTK